ncbi:LOW QUALITY PROTEIN: hypothetical protein U9M48_023337 [Paspalum notatum var. saurae]|uniref:Integrase catalytic domain-containing protein n=1 Tax=Paspalum notatum var. saurae TaxID=547442 RepID=A0AAQ3TNU2_PASNO
MGHRAALAHVDDTVRGTVHFGDGSVVEIRGLGSMVTEGRTREHKVLTDVYYVPKLKSNIISLGKLEQEWYKVVLENGVLTVFDRESTLLIRAPRTKNRTYTIKLNVTSLVCLLSKCDDQAWVWHAQYGHLNFRALREFGTKKMVEGMPVIDHVNQVCDGCTIGKQHCSPFPRASSFRAERGLELVYSDLCDLTTHSWRQALFFLVVDDFSQFMWVELLATKDQALHYIKKIKASSKNELGEKLKAIITDRGGEFKPHLFILFCNETGIKHFTTTPYTPQQNGVVERRNQNVVEMARCMLKSKVVPPKFLGKPKVSHLCTFGCVAHMKNTGPSLNKLSDRSTKMVFFGYEQGSKGYRLFDPVSKKLYVSRDVVFEENRAWEWSSKWDSPPTGQAVDSKGLPQYIYNVSKEIRGYEYSGLCLLAIDEPSSVEKALTEKC